jgi:hypothetical protein
LSLKIYSKGEYVLRIEAMVHNASEAETPFRRNLADFPKTMGWMKDVLERFLGAVHCVGELLHRTWTSMVPACVWPCSRPQTVSGAAVLYTSSTQENFRLARFYPNMEFSHSRWTGEKSTSGRR